jgi:hypothetical protein
VGVEPDIDVAITPAQEQARLLRAAGALQGLPDKMLEEIEGQKDPQLDRAREVLRGIELFAQRMPETKGDADAVVATGPRPQESVH